MNRREFLIASAAVGAFARTRLGRSQGVNRADRAKLDRIGIMSFNFGSVLKLPGQPEGPNRTLEALDIPQMYADRYGVHNIELQNNHILSTETSYLNDLRARVEKVKSRITQINVRFDTSLSSAEAAQRTQAIDQCKSWVDRAAILGCARLMVNQGQVTAETKEHAIASLKAIGEHAKSKGVMITMETGAQPPGGRGRGRGPRGGPGGRGVAAEPPPTPAAPVVLPPAPAWVVDDATNAAWRQANPAVMPSPVPGTADAAWGSPTAVNRMLLDNIKASGTYVNIDLGGMGVETQEDMNTALRELMPANSGSLHINWRDNPGWDLPATIRQIRDLGYKGIYVLEVAGATDPYLVTQGLVEVVLANM